MASFIAYINHRYLKLTPAIGMMAFSLCISILLIVGQGLFPAAYGSLTRVIASIDLHDVLMNSMLGFLLFAGAMHIDASSLRAESMPVIALASIGVLLSTAIVGILLFYLFPVAGLDIPLIYCLLFASLISATDPIASLAILKKAGLSHKLELQIAGESLFNDGVAVVVFLTLLSIARSGVDQVSVGSLSLLLLQQAGGGLLLGIVLGYSSYLAIRSIDQYQVEVMITIATVMGGYLLAEKVHVSGPLAMVAAGILIGNKSRSNGVSDITRDYLEKFWELTDELLNALLFMLIGFEMLLINLDRRMVVMGVATIGIVLAARWVSVAIPVSLLRTRMRFEKHTIAILTWGGLRGALSVALALSLPAHMYRDQFVTMTYVVVVFSILVQGLTIGKLYKKLKGRDA